MAKSLSEMNLEELWKLFPIFLTEHQVQWAAWYEEEAAFLRDTIGRNLVRISHAGSTAIHGIWAKPVIDILVELETDSDMDNVSRRLSDINYTIMSESENRISLNKGYTEHGFAEKVYHLHLRYRGDNDELYFRDYLNEYPRMAREYEALKLSLWKKYEHDRDGYTNAKTAFVSDCTKKARAEYGNRYQ